MPLKKTLKILSSQNNICMEITEAATVGILCKTLLLKISEYSQKKTCVTISFFDQDTKPATLSKKRFQHRCFPVNIAKFLRTPIFKNTC